MISVDWEDIICNSNEDKSEIHLYSSSGETTKTPTYYKLFKISSPFDI
jgi:hypothetical protein